LRGIGGTGKGGKQPHFCLVNEYQGRLHVFHIDLYRVDDLTEEFGIGMLDYIARAGSGVVVLEWAEKALPLLPDDNLQVHFEVISARKRQLEFTGFGQRFSKLLRELGEK
jgi:tRNA threonylcarbamoyladenosine biosynthesis protein TsaE